MLLISGSAQFTLENEQYNKGDSHSITLFSNNENLDESLTSIESYLNNLGWDEIIIEASEILANDAEIAHDVLKNAYEKAAKEGLSVVVNNTPLASAA